MTSGRFTRVFTSFDEPDADEPELLVLRIWRKDDANPSHKITLPADEGLLRGALGTLRADGWARHHPTDPPTFDYVEGLPSDLLEAIKRTRRQDLKTPTLIILDATADEVAARAESLCVLSRDIHVQALQRSSGSANQERPSMGKYYEPDDYRRLGFEVSPPEGAAPGDRSAIRLRWPGFSGAGAPPHESAPIPQEVVTTERLGDESWKATTPTTSRLDRPALGATEFEAMTRLLLAL